MVDRSSGLLGAPFWLRRPLLLLEGARVDRDMPDLEALGSLQPAERFVWSILPHAARSFAPCIIALPARISLPMAVGYLYCRTLDTYEDLVADPGARRSALAALPARLELLRVGEAVPPRMVLSYECVDRRDEAHALLADQIDRLDVLFQGFPAPVQVALIDLVKDMSLGMSWASGVFDAQDGALCGQEQLSEYCLAVLGNPIRFAARLFQWRAGRGIDLGRDVEQAATDVGEFLQLANITRDIEKDLLRGVCYHEGLAQLASSRSASDTELIRSVRAALTDRAISLAPAYLRLVEGMGLKAGLMSASALMMLRFTELHYQGTLTLVGVSGVEAGRARGAILASLPGAISGRWAKGRMREVVGRLVELRSKLSHQASSMYLS